MNTPQDLIGTTLAGKYFITDVLGEGAMGIVYRGFDDTNLNEVAIKVLQPSLADNEDVVARFHREATAARRVDHEATVRVLGRGREAGIHYLVMELLRGKSLADVLHEEGRLPEGRAARLVIQLCGALAVAHERGVVHRDIKPENIMVLAGCDKLGERVKLLDFGIAKRHAGAVPAVGIEDSFNLGDETRMGALLGTPEYMSPEQCTGHDVGPRTDIYACGILLYRMVTGVVPFGAADTHYLEVFQRHLGEAPMPPRARHPSISLAMETVILKALQKAPSQRYQSAAELRDALTEVLAGIEQIEMEPTRPFMASDAGLLDASDLLDLTATLPFVRGSDPPAASAPEPPSSEQNIPTLVIEPTVLAAPAPVFMAPAPMFTAPMPVLDAPVLTSPARRAAPPSAGDSTPPSARTSLQRRSRVQAYLPAIAFAAVIGAGLGSLFMALAPLLQH